MNDKIKNVLNKLVSNGFDAYVVGGYVRDYLLDIPTYDVDIATNARPKEIIDVFELSSSNEDNYGSIRIKDSLYNYDITTFRSELTYDNRHPDDFYYVDTIEEDIKRRDFTINSLYMNIDGEIIDLLGGKVDIENKTIKVIGLNNRLSEDPLRILRAVRFAATLDFDLEPTLINYIRQNTQLIQTLSCTRKKDELELIFKSQNRLKGIELLKNLKLDEYLGINLKNVSDVSNSLGIWAQIEPDETYNFKKSEKEKMKNILAIKQYGTIDEMVLYQYGIYLSVIAGEIMGLDIGYISSIYNNLPIFSARDIALNGNDIMDILKIKGSSKIKNIIADLEINILNRTLENKKEEIEKYLLENWSDCNE